ncbi:hypothetical protein Tco_1387837 [Tanacetum coccineum]
MANNRTDSSIIGRLILAASSYYLWLERNSRIFKKVKKSLDEIKDIIMVTVRLKLLTFKFKNTAKGQYQKAIEEVQIAEGFDDEGEGMEGSRVTTLAQKARIRRVWSLVAHCLSHPDNGGITRRDRE